MQQQFHYSDTKHFVDSCSWDVIEQKGKKESKQKNEQKFQNQPFVILP